MKKPLLLLALMPLSLAFTTPIAAQTTATPASTQTEALALMDKAAAAYGALDGLALNYRCYEEQNGKTTVESGLLEFEKKGGVRVTDLTNGSFTLANAPRDNSVKAAKKSLADAMESLPGSLSMPMSFLAQGESPLRHKITGLSRSAAVWKNIALLPDGGVRAALSVENPSHPRGYDLVWTFYIDARDFLLRRVEVKAQIGDRAFSNIAALSQIQRNPPFEIDTFLPPRPAPEVKRDFHDPKLVIGAAPFALTGADLGGKVRDLSDYKGKVVLLDFWATWCGPCARELPNVLANYKKYHTKGFEIIGVSLDEDKKSLTDFVGARKMPWPQLFDGKGWQNQNAARFGVKAIPFTLLIGKDGEIAAVNPRGEALETALKAALGG